MFQPELKFRFFFPYFIPVSWWLFLVFRKKKEGLSWERKTKQTLYTIYCSDIHRSQNYPPPFLQKKSDKGELGQLSQHHITGHFNTEATSELQRPKSYCGVFSVTSTELNALEPKTKLKDRMGPARSGEDLGDGDNEPPVVGREWVQSPGEGRWSWCDGKPRTVSVDPLGNRRQSQGPSVDSRSQKSRESLLLIRGESYGQGPSVTCLIGSHRDQVTMDRSIDFTYDQFTWIVHLGCPWLL